MEEKKTVMPNEEVEKQQPEVTALTDEQTDQVAGGMVASSLAGPLPKQAHA